MKNNIILLIFALSSFFYSCDDMLNEVPSKQKDIVPTDVSHLEGIFANHGYKLTSMGVVMLMSDDYIPLKTIHNKNSRAFGSSDAQFHVTWNSKNIALSSRDRELPWEKAYKNIFTANTVLSYISDVKGTDAEKKQVRADALFWRAYEHFTLVSTFCLPYKKDGSADDELGIPIQDRPSLSHFPGRGTLKGTYNFILNDLKEAEKTLKDIPLVMGSTGTSKQWRSSAPALYALLAKVYLTIGDYENAGEYAQKAISNKGAAELVDYKTEMSYAQDALNQEFDIVISKDETIKETVYLPKFANTDWHIYDWNETLYKREASEPYNDLWLVPSEDLMNIYGTNEVERENDLRWKYLFVENYSYTNENYRGNISGDTYTPNEKIPVFRGMDNIGPTLGEMYLIKAECQARANDFKAAEQTINILRDYRFAADASNRDVTFNSVEDAIQKILNERRREMPFIARWYDMKRIAANGEFSYLPDNVSREFYEVHANGVDGSKPMTYTFSPQDDYLKFAIPISNKEIIALSAFGASLKRNKY